MLWRSPQREEIPHTCERPERGLLSSPAVIGHNLLWDSGGSARDSLIAEKQDPRGVLEGLGPTVAESAIVYETSDLKKLAEPRKAAADARSVETINFADKFARVHLARLCSAVSER